MNGVRTGAVGRWGSGSAKVVSWTEAEWTDGWKADAGEYHRVLDQRRCPRRSACVCVCITSCFRCSWKSEVYVQQPANARWIASLYIT